MATSSHGLSKLLKQGDFYCEPEFPTVICHEYQGGVIHVGLRGTFEPSGMVKRRNGESRVAAATRKLTALSHRAAAAGAAQEMSAASIPVPIPRELKDLGGPTEEQQPEVRTRTPTSLFEPVEQLRDCATGAQKKKRPAGECCGAPCCKKARAELEEARAERAVWQERAEAAAAELRGLKAEMHGRIEALEEELQHGAAALQQAALSLLDGKEECIVRLRLVPGELRASKLTVVVYDPAEDTEQDCEEATAVEQPARPPQPPPQPPQSSSAPVVPQRNAFSALMSGAAAAARRPAAAAASASAPTAAPAASGRAAPAVLLTARVAAGRALRAEVERAARLRRGGKVKEADAALAQLAATAKEPTAALAQKRASQLRDETFSYGDLASSSTRSGAATSCTRRCATSWSTRCSSLTGCSSRAARADRRGATSAPHLRGSTGLPDPTRA